MRKLPNPVHPVGGNNRPRPDDGATSVEYGLLIALIAAAMVIAVILFGGAVAGLFTETHSTICNESPGGCTEPG